MDNLTQTPVRKKRRFSRKARNRMSRAMKQVWAKKREEREQAAGPEFPFDGINGIARTKPEVMVDLNPITEHAFQRWWQKYGSGETTMIGIERLAFAGGIDWQHHMSEWP